MQFHTPSHSIPPLDSLLIVEFLENRRSWENQKTQKSPEKGTFLNLAFYNAPSLHTIHFKAILNLSGYLFKKPSKIPWG